MMECRWACMASTGCVPVSRPTMPPPPPPWLPLAEAARRAPAHLRHAVGDEGGEVVLADGLARGAAAVAKHHVRRAVFDQLHLACQRLEKGGGPHDGVGDVASGLGQCVGWQADMGGALRRHRRPPTPGCRRRHSGAARPARPTCSFSSSASLARWNSSSGFCTQIAESSTQWDAPCARPASSALSVAW